MIKTVYVRKRIDTYNVLEVVQIFRFFLRSKYDISSCTIFTTPRER